MSYRNSRRIGSNRNRRRSNILSMQQPLPKIVRDELRMCTALRGYSQIRLGEGKTLVQQHNAMETFFHGREGSAPSQIQMLAEGTSVYKDLYQIKAQSMIVSKKTTTKNKKKVYTRRHLKQKFSRDENRLYYIGSDITHSDLEKKNRTGQELLNGRQITDMAKRGLRDYRKALAFACEKWDMKKCQAKESGTTVDDVIEHVRRKMYLKSVIRLESEDDSERELVEVIKKKRKSNDIISKVTNPKSNDINTTLDAPRVTRSSPRKIASPSTKEDTNSKKRKTTEKNKKGKKKKDDDSDSDSNSDDDNDESDYDVDELSTVSEIDSDDEDEVPNDYIFPSFMAFVLWGPFAEKENQLTLFLLGKTIV